MSPNLLVLIGCAFIPLIVAFVWYHPKIAGNAYRKAIKMSEEEFNKPPGILKIGLSLLMYFFIAFGMFVITVHQTHILALTGPDPALLKTGVGAAFMAEYGNNFLGTSHGLAHGILGFFAFALPFSALSAMWEKKGIKYVLVDGGYWLISLLIMGVVISNWGGVPIK